MKIRTILADDHRIVRDGLRSLLNSSPDIQVIAEAADGHRALELCQEHKPQVLAADIGLPGLNGIELTRAICSNGGATKMVALSMHYDMRFVEQMLQAGALGYLPKDAAGEELIAAIKAAAEGRRYLSERLAEVVVAGLTGSVPALQSSLLQKLTRREREVLQGMAEGFNTKQIAMTLSISTKTVETHRRQLMDKLGLYNVAQLTKVAIREGLTSLDT